MGGPWEGPGMVPEGVWEGPWELWEDLGSVPGGAEEAMSNLSLCFPVFGGQGRSGKSTSPLHHLLASARMML